MFTLTRMAVRAGVLAALIATIMSVASGLAAQGEWEAIEAHAVDALDWLGSLLERLGGIDPSVGDIRLADLTSPAGWIDLGAGLFGGGTDESPLDAIDVARFADAVPTENLDGLADAVPSEQVSGLVDAVPSEQVSGLVDAVPLDDLTGLARD